LGPRKGNFALAGETSWTTIVPSYNKKMSVLNK
jgi:hypothetical protein